MLIPEMLLTSGMNKNATKTESGTLNATKKALVTPIKNIRMISTSINPMMIVLISSVKEVFVCLLVSPVNSTRRLLGNSPDFCMLSTSAFTLSAQSIRFSPDRFTIFNVTTFFPSRRAKLSFSFTVSFNSATSRR